MTRTAPALALLGLLATACPRPGPTPARDAAVAHAATPIAAAAETPPAPAPGPGAQSEEACVDAWLAEHHLDRYGNPPDTVYLGGTPLFNERTGENIRRLDYVYDRQPRCKTACEALRRALVACRQIEAPRVPPDLDRSIRARVRHLAAERG